MTCLKRDFIFSEVWFLTFLQYSWVTLELLVELLLYSPQTGRKSHPCLGQSVLALETLTSSLAWVWLFLVLDFFSLLVARALPSFPPK